MKWRGRRGSSQVSDQRGGGGSGGRAMKLGGGSIVGVLLLMGVTVLTGQNPLAFLQNLNLNSATGPSAPRSAAEEELAKFVSVVLADTEEVWDEQFKRMGRQYVKPKLVLFTGKTQSGCGFADAQVGPFYCPADQTIYIDLSFYQQLQKDLNAPGDFAQAYVIAHEVGHHVQHLLGTLARVRQMKEGRSKTEQNALQVRVELQADFLAGVWAKHADRRWSILEPGDLEEAINAAEAIGDDTLQKRSHGHVVPDSFTHGTSAQRAEWFRRGFSTGDVKAGDTFGVNLN